MPISAVDTITLAFEHTRRQLFQPFRFSQWVRLAIVGLLAGEMGSGGGVNFPSGFPFPHQPGSPRYPVDLPHIAPAILGLIAIMMVAGFIFFIVMMYVSSVMRFILFDSVLAKECHIRQGWSRRQGPGWKYFLWQIGFMLATFGGLAIFVGIPAAFALAMGWFSPPSEHVLPLVLGGIVLFFLVLFFFLIAAVIHVLTKDFVVPQMALEGIGAIEGWQRLWLMMRTEPDGYAMYVGMKIVLAIGAGIILGLATIILSLIVAIPTLALGIIGVLAGKTAGLTWNVFTITIAVVVGCILLAVFYFLLSLLAVPVIVFFPAYAIYFFAARYRPLSLALYPPPPSIAPLPDATPG